MTNNDKNNWAVIETIKGVRYMVWSTPECPIACGQNEWKIAAGLSKTAAEKKVARK